MEKTKPKSPFWEYVLNFWQYISQKFPLESGQDILHMSVWNNKK